MSLRLLSLVGETVRGCVNVEDLKDRQWLIIGSNGTVGLHNSGDLATVLAAHGGSAWVLDLNKVVEETAV